MDINSKVKVLLAIYSEYQRELPNMKESIISEKLGWEQGKDIIAKT